MNLPLSNRARTLLLAALIVGLLLMNAPASASRAAGATTDPRFGIVNAFEAPDAAFESGASWELLTLRWDQIQPDGPAQWTPPLSIDQWLQQARANGREVAAVLVGTPAWATDGKPGIGVPRGLTLPVTDANNVWASFVRQAVGYYGARGINRYVIWDTPDILPGDRAARWEGSTADYYQLLKVAYVVGKGANPGVVIHMAGISDSNPSWFGHFLDVAAADPSAAANNSYFDVATVHVFNSPERVYTLTANPSYLMNQAGIPLKPVWVNQTNARPAVDPAVYPPDATFRVASKITQEQQAAFIIQAYALAFSAGADRVAVYRLADNLPEDGKQAFGLVRQDGDARPAFKAYQTVVQEFSGFKLARRVDQETHPLIDYVRLTFPDKVTHIVWALTQQNATLVIPARSELATLIDLEGNRSLVKPQGGVYKVVAGGADCNDPNTVGGCLIGGAPWILVENGVNNPLNEVAPKATVEIGGVVPTPDVGSILTATAAAMPTATPTNTPIPPTDTPVPPPATPTLEATAAPEVTAAPEATTESPTAAVVEVSPAPSDTPMPAPTPTLTPEEALRPRGISAFLPYGLVALGALVIGGGVWFFLRGRGVQQVIQFVEPPFSPHPPETQETRSDDESAPPADETVTSHKTKAKRGRGSKKGPTKKQTGL